VAGRLAAPPTAQPADAPAARDVPVRLVDERLSTVDAQRGLRDSGVDTRRGRSVVDQAAAVIILQTALDTERQSGTAPGRLVGGSPPPDRPRDEGAGRHGQQAAE
jgi:hypothetical protein